MAATQVGGRTPGTGWQDALDAAGGSLPAPLRSARFLADEYAQVVLPNRITSREAYYKVRRPGRGVALDRPGLRRWRCGRSRRRSTARTRRYGASLTSGSAAGCGTCSVATGRAPALVVPGADRQEASPGTVGTAADWLLRFMLRPRPSLALAARGAALCGPRSGMAEALIEIAEVLGYEPEAVLGVSAADFAGPVGGGSSAGGGGGGGCLDRYLPGLP